MSEKQPPKSLQKKKRHTCRFPPGRIKKIMQKDEEIGKVAAAVPQMISRILELFVESLLAKTVKITDARHAKTLSTAHLRQCIMSETRFDFLRELVRNVADINVNEDAGGSPERSLSPSPPLDVSQSSSGHDLGSNHSSFGGKIPNPNNCFGQPSTSGLKPVQEPLNLVNKAMPQLPTNAPISFDGSFSSGIKVAIPSLYHDIASSSGAQVSSTTGPGDPDAASNSQLLRRKLSDASASSTMTSRASKLSRISSLPATFRIDTDVQPLQSTSSKAATPEPVHFVTSSYPPMYNLPEVSITPIIKIDYNAAAEDNRHGSPQIRVDFSNAMVSSSEAASGNRPKELPRLKIPVSIPSTVNIPNLGLTTPGLTTPTHLNHVPFGTTTSTTSSRVLNAPGPSTAATSTASERPAPIKRVTVAEELDEDYDDI